MFGLHLNAMSPNARVIARPPRRNNKQQEQHIPTMTDAYDIVLDYTPRECNSRKYRV